MVVLSGEDDPITKIACAMAVRNFSDDPLLRQVVLDSGAAASVVALASAPDSTIQEHCAIALCNLSMVQGGEVAVIARVIS